MKKQFLAGVLSALLLSTTWVSVYAEGFDNFNWSNQAIEFIDVPQDSWYYSSVSGVSACGIISGVGNNQFNPLGTLTHAEAMTLMAKTYAIFSGKVEELAEAQASSMGSHWAFGILSFCHENALPYPSDAELDIPISRSTMAHYFYNSLPASAFDTGTSNNPEDMPEKTDNVTVQDLFKAGVLVGDDSGFRLEDPITRAEAAAIIQRVANPAARVKVTKNPQTQEQPENQVTEGEVQTDKPYKRIPNTDWSTDPTGGVTVKSQFGDINTKYGNHAYGCERQKEYDKVMSVIDEAFLYACEKETDENYYKNALNEIKKPDSDMVKFYKSQVGIKNNKEIANMRVTENLVSNMRQYLTDTYATPNGAGKNKNYHNNNVHNYLFAGGFLDCDGNGYFNMLCWDYLGFSTRMITSMKIAHATAQVYVNGHWIMLNQDNGKLDFCTHEQLLELISGIKNDAYSTKEDTDAMIKGASEAIDNGKTSYRPDDLEIWEKENPTHAPSDTSVK